MSPSPADPPAPPPQSSPRHVLRALGLTDEAAHSSLRFGLGRFTTEEEVDFVAERLIDVVRKLREFSPQYAYLT